MSQRTILSILQVDGVLFDSLVDQGRQAAKSAGEEECLGAVYLAMQLQSDRQSSESSPPKTKQLQMSSFEFAEGMDRGSIGLILSYLPSQ